MVIPIVLMGLATSLYYQDVMRQSVMSDTLSSAKTISALTPEYMNASQLYIKSIADRPLVIKAMEDNDTSFLQSMAEYTNNTSRINSVYFTDDGGVVVQSTGPISSLIGSNVSNRSYVGTVLRTGEPVIGDAEPGYDGLPVVPIAVPIMDNSTLLGVMVGTVNLNDYANLLKDAITSSQYLYLVNGTGHVMVDGNQEYAQNMTDFNSVPVVQDVLGGKTGSSEYYNPIYNEWMIGSYSPINLTGWGVVVALPQGVAYQPIWNTTWLIVAATILLSLFAIGLGLFLGNSIVFPIEDLSKAMNTAFKSDEDGYRSSLPLGRKDEIGDLSRSFDGMVDMVKRETAAREQAVEELRASEKRLEADLAATMRLREVSTRFVREGDLNSLLADIMDAAIAIAGADKGTLQLLRPGSDHLEIVAQHGFDKPFLDFFSSVSHVSAAVCGMAMSQGERVIVEDVTKSPIFMGTPALDVQLAAGVRAVQSTPLVDRRGKVIGILTTHWSEPYSPDEQVLRYIDLLARQAADHIERIQAEEAHSQLAAIVESSSDAIISKTLDGIITSWNKGAEEVYGYKQEEVIGKPISTLAPPGHPDEVPRILERIKHGEVIVYYDTQRVRKDGRQIDVSLTVSPIKDINGHIIGASTIARDITERKQFEMAREQLLGDLKTKTCELEQLNEELSVKTEELAVQSEELECANEELRTHNEELQNMTRSLHETSDYLDKLINYASAPIIVWDPKFNITRFNHAFERLSGYMAKEIIGEDLSILFPPDSRKESLEKIKRTLEGEQWESVEIPILHKSGGISIVLWNSTNIYGEDNSLLATIAQGQDITSRKQAEKELVESESQAELYLDLMGHDISNMHQIITGQLEIAEDILREEGRLEGDDKELIDTSIKTLDRAAKLIDNVRKLRRLRSGDYHIEPIDLSALLEEVLKDYSNIPEREITIKYTPDGARLVRANALLKDVFTNILDNAIKHTSGQLILAVNISHVSHDGKSYYRVALDDNGKGIPDDKKEEVFDRFKRGDTEARGTGLGLYIVKTLIEGFGGHVEVLNRVLEDYTKGTRFLIYLPVMEEKDAGN
jgi:PAS domain S-box-containing protein